MQTQTSVCGQSLNADITVATNCMTTEAGGRDGKGEVILIT